MYMTPNFSGVTQPVVPLQQIANNFNFAAQTPDQELNALTPKVAMAAAGIFLQSLEKNHPVRVAAYNVAAANYFVNDYFRSFINICMRSALVAFESQQTTSINDVITRFLPDWVNMFCAAIAVSQPAVIQQLDMNTATSVQQLAQKYAFWIKEVEMKSNEVAMKMQQRAAGGGFATNFGGQQAGMPGQIPGMPGMGVPNVNALAGNSGMIIGDTNVQDPAGVKFAPNTGHYARKLAEANAQAAFEAQEAARAADAPKFNMGSDIAVIEGNTSVMAGQEYVSPYARKLKDEMIQAGALDASGAPKSRWGDVTDTTVKTPVQPAAAPAPASVQRPVSTGPAATLPSTQADIVAKAEVAEAISQGAKDFDAAILDFTQDPTPVKVVAPTPETHLEKKAILSTTTMNGHKLDVVGILTDVTPEQAGWKPSKFQHYFPAWCRRTHELLYAIAESGEVVAVPTPYKPEEALKVFNYEAHAINIHSGNPERVVDTLPREEAQVLYSPDPSNVKIHVDEARQASTTIGELEQQAQMESLPAFTKDKNLQLSVMPGIVYEYQGYLDEASATAAFEELREVRLKVTYDSSAKAIAAIKSPVLRKKINDLFTLRFNELLRERLGIAGSIESYIDEAADASEEIRAEMGDLLADALISQQSEFIATAMDVVMAEEVDDVARNFCPAEDEEGIKTFLRNTIFITTNHVVMNSRFTGDELAIGTGAYASQLDADSYPVLHKAIQDAMQHEMVKGVRNSTYTLQSVDGARFRIFVSALNPDIILIKAL